MYEHQRDTKQWWKNARSSLIGWEKLDTKDLRMPNSQIQKTVLKKNRGGHSNHGNSKANHPKDNSTMWQDTTTKTVTSGKNWSSIPLMKAQEHLLGPWTKFCYHSKVSTQWRIHCYNGAGLPKLIHGEAKELQAEVKAVLKKTQPLTPNIKRPHMVVPYTKGLSWSLCECM